jgi:MSHA pilin protein MshD
MFMATEASYSRQHGISLIELIMFIVIISASLAGILSVMNLVTRNSANPLIQKQALAIAESLLEEVELMPFTFCDPDDASAVTAASAVVGGTGCQSMTEGVVLGPEAGETRGGATPFDNVDDYNAAPFVAGALVDISGNPVPPGYSAAITVAHPAVALGVVPVSETLLITVSVTGPVGGSVILDGYRTRYAPNALP